MFQRVYNLSMNTSQLTNDQYLALETLSRAIVARNLPDLRIGIRDSDVLILSTALENLERDLSFLPAEYLEFFATEVVMMLAANTDTDDLRLGVGELPSD